MCANKSERARESEMLSRAHGNTLPPLILRVGVWSGSSHGPFLSYLLPSLKFLLQNVSLSPPGFCGSQATFSPSVYRRRERKE